MKTLKEILIVQGGFEEIIETENIIECVEEWLMQKRQEYPLEEQKFGDYFRNKAKLSLIDELLEELAQEGTQASK